MRIFWYQFVFFLLMGINWYLYSSLTRSRPQVPDISKGLVVPLTDHGKTYFLTHFEYLIYHGTLIVPVFMALGILIFEFIGKGKSK